MPMFRILHCADLHLDASFASHLPASVGSRRRAGLRAVFERILTLARERQVDALTIAGDLYEDACVTPDTARFLQGAFASLAPIPVLIAPGECDPYTAQSLYALLHWPDNVILFKPGPLSPCVLTAGVTVWSTAHPPKDRARLLDVAPNQGANLLLLHAAGPNQAPPDGDDLLQVSEAGLRSAGMDLALLGHIHAGCDHLEGGTRWVYPGSPEPLASAEAGGTHGVALVTVDGAARTVEHIPLSRWRYVPWRVDLSGCGAAEDVPPVVAASLRELYPPLDDHTILELVLTGRRHLEPDLQDLRARLGAAYVRCTVELPSPYDTQRLAAELSARGLLVRHLQERLASATTSGERAELQDAQTLALLALEGRRVRPYATG